MNLVILLHGYGSTSAEIASAFSNLYDMPYLDILSINAPNKCDIFKNKFQWFKLSYLNEYLTKEIIFYSRNLYDVIYVKEKMHLKYSSIFIVGHSQGAMIASYMAINYNLEKTTTICISAILPFIASIKQSVNKQQIVFIHGAEDNMIPINNLLNNFNTLLNLGYNVSFMPFSGATHSISILFQQAVADFIKQ